MNDRQTELESNRVDCRQVSRLVLFQPGEFLLGGAGHSAKDSADKDRPRGFSKITRDLRPAEIGAGMFGLLGLGEVAVLAIQDWAPGVKLVRPPNMIF